MSAREAYPRRADHNTVAQGGNRRWAETAGQERGQRLEHGGQQGAAAARGVGRTCPAVVPAGVRGEAWCAGCGGRRRTTSKSFDLRARNARAGGGAGVYRPPCLRNAPISGSLLRRCSAAPAFFLAATRLRHAERSLRFARWRAFRPWLASSTRRPRNGRPEPFMRALSPAVRPALAASRLHVRI